MLFNNESGLKFVDISTEKYREYNFGDKFVRIEFPLWLNISQSGGHRVFDVNNVSHYIPKGWIHLKWEAKVGAPNFIK